MTIRIEDDIPDLTAIRCVEQVIKAGKISDNGKCYCYATTFSTPLGEVVVATLRNRKSPCFRVYKTVKTTRI